MTDAMGAGPWGAAGEKRYHCTTCGGPADHVTSLHEPVGEPVGEVLPPGLRMQILNGKMGCDGGDHPCGDPSHYFTRRDDGTIGHVYCAVHGNARVAKGEQLWCPQWDGPSQRVALAAGAPAPEAFVPGSRAWVAALMDETFGACRALCGAGQAEYARRDDVAFANFDRIAERLGAPHTPETVLLTYCEKHIDGIHAHVAGHTSQREPVEGRIHDAIVYLVLLKGLIARRRAGEVRA